MKRTIAIALILILAFAFSACSKGNDFTCADVVNSAANQQRWLRSFESNIVVNPEAIGAESYTDADGKLGIDLGITDADGNIVKVLNDVVFFIETNFANGKGGEVIWSAVYTGDGTNATFNMKDDATNTSDGTTAIITCGTENGASVTPKRHKQTLDNITDYYLVVNVTSMTSSKVNDDGSLGEPKLGINGTLTNPIEKLDIAVVTVPGSYVYQLNSLAFDGTETAATRVFIPRLDFEKYCSYTVTEYAIKTFAPGYTYADAKMSNIWYPYQIVSTQSYNNGTALKVEDMIVDENSVSRIVTTEMGGTAYIAGLIDGNSVVYDDKSDTLQIKGDGYEYSICCKRNAGITYYDSEEDMLSDTNGSAEYKSTSRYWVMSQVTLSVGDTFNVGISAAADGIDTQQEAKNAVLNATIKKFRNDIETKWNEFIANNDVSDYIQNIPEGK